MPYLHSEQTFLVRNDGFTICLLSSAPKFSILISNYALKKNARAVSTSHTRKIEFSVVLTVIIEDPSARQWNLGEAQAISRSVTWSIEAAAV